MTALALLDRRAPAMRRIKKAERIRVLRRLGVPLFWLKRPLGRASVEAYEDVRQYPKSLRHAEWLREMVRRFSRGAAPSKPGHWLPGDVDDAGADWCFECACKRVVELKKENANGILIHIGCSADELAAMSDAELCKEVVDGGWSSEYDHPCYCEGCGVRLDHSLTFFGAEAEVDFWLNEYAPDDPDCWDLLLLAVDQIGADTLVHLWPAVDQIVMRHFKNLPHRSRLRRTKSVHCEAA